MKKLQTLLLTATFVSLVPSAKLLSEDNPIDASTTKIETIPPFNPADSEIETIPQMMLSTILHSKNALAKYKHLLDPDLGAIITPPLASYGLLAGLQGSHSLKNLKRKLLKTPVATTLAPEILLNINKGIRSNRRLIGASFGAIALSTAYITKLFNEGDKTMNQTFSRKNE